MLVPNIYRLHNEPHDYYCYANDGLMFFLARAGFSKNAISASGGLFSLFGDIIVNLTFGAPLLNNIVMWFNKIFVQVVTSVDCRVEKRISFALNCIVLNQKSQDRKIDDK